MSKLKTKAYVNYIKKLRSYQEDAITQARMSFKQGLKRIMIWLATGGGKSVIFGQITANF